MINIEKGRYWDLPWSLVSGCTPCSPGCDHCWSAGITYRFDKTDGGPRLAVANPDHPDGKVPPFFTGHIITHPDRLDIPLKRKKPTVFAVWNDLYHEKVPGKFINDAWLRMINSKKHTFLILSKRPEVMLKWTQVAARAKAWLIPDMWPDHICLGLTICNQQEADEKIPVFLQVPGKKFLSIEPMLGPISFRWKDYFLHKESYRQYLERTGSVNHLESMKDIDAVILGGETGPGARPMNMAWAQSVRDQCMSANIPFFFKSWGDSAKGGMRKEGWLKVHRLLDGRTHDDLPWIVR